MKRKVETGLIVVKEDVFTEIRRNLFFMFYRKEAIMLEMLEELVTPKNKVTGNIIIPKEIKIKR